MFRVCADCVLPSEHIGSVLPTEDPSELTGRGNEVSRTRLAKAEPEALQENQNQCVNEAKFSKNKKSQLFPSHSVIISVNAIYQEGAF